MRNLKVNIGFKGKKDAEILQYALTVVQAMTDNANFPEPNPALVDVQTAIADYQEKLAKASQKGSPLDISLKNESKLLLAAILKRLGLYVNAVAEGNMPLLLSSGFTLAAQPISGLLPEKPMRLRLSDGQLSGQIRFDFDKVDRGMLYEYSYAVQNEQGTLVWSERQSVSSSVNNILTSAEPGKTYYLRVRSVNRSGASDWCDPVSLIAR